MIKLNLLHLASYYPHLSKSSIKAVIWQAHLFMQQVEELAKFLHFYDLHDEAHIKDFERFSFPMIHVVLSLKKRIDALYKEAENGVLIHVISLQNELDHTLLQEHFAAFFLKCAELQKSIKNLFDKRLEYTAKNLSAENSCDQNLENELRGSITTLRSQLNDLKQSTHALTVCMQRSCLSGNQDAVSSVEPTNRDHLFFSMPEEIKVSILAHLNVEDLLTVQIASKKLLTTAATAFAVHFKKKPAQVLAHLNQLPPEKAYAFVEGYRRTSEYKALTCLVEQKLPMSNLEIACYMLTRHHNQFPDLEQLKITCNDPHIDLNTRDHLLVLMKNVPTIDGYRLFYSPAYIEQNNKLFVLFQQNYPKRYINLLPSIDLEKIELIGADLSYAPLSHAHIRNTDMSAMNLFQANLSYADLRYSTLKQTNLQQANLAWANWNGARFIGTLIDGANFTGANLGNAQFINVDMRTIDLSQVHVEWCYLSNVRLVPNSALEDTDKLDAFFCSFEKTLMTHPLGSQMKLRWHMLKDLKQLLMRFSLSPENKMMYFKLILTHYPLETFSRFLFIKMKHPLKKLFEKKGLIPVDDTQEKIGFPLQEEVISILDKLQDRLDHADDASEIYLSDLADKFSQCFTRVPGLTNVNQICHLSSHYFFLLQLFYYYKPLSYTNSVKPYLVNCSANTLKAPQPPQKYASQIFDGELFDIKRLQKINPEELYSYLYGEEDFVTKEEKTGLNRVKLGGLLISYTPGWIGTYTSTVEIIDFQNKKLEFGFSIDGKDNFLKPELSYPLNMLNYDVLTHYGSGLDPDKIADIRAALELRKNLVNYILATQQGPLPEMIPLTRIVPLTKKDDTQAVVNRSNHLTEAPLPGNSPHGLFYRKTDCDFSLTVAEKISCLLT